MNKNSVPNDPRSPFITSGLRLGTPAITTRGFKAKETAMLSHWVADVLDNINDDTTIAAVQLKVLQLCREFPVYG